MRPGVSDPRLWSRPPAPTSESSTDRVRRQVGDHIRAANAAMAQPAAVELGGVRIQLPFRIPECNTFQACQLEVRRADPLWARMQQAAEIEAQGQLRTLYRDRADVIRARRESRASRDTTKVNRR